MSALLEERSKRQKEKHDEPASQARTKGGVDSGDAPKRDLKSLVESVKRKSAAADQRSGVGKRRKL